MPVDGYAEAKPADVNEEDVLHAYDITIFYRYGKEFEPDESSPINVSFRSDAIADAITDDGVELEAEHIADDGKKESVELTSAENGEAAFEADRFSIYVIKAHDNNSDYVETPRIIYHFLSPDYLTVSGESGSDESGTGVNSAEIYYQAGEYLSTTMRWSTNTPVSAAIITRIPSMVIFTI